MQPDIDAPAQILSQIDKDELTDLVNILLLSSGMKTIFAITPEPNPQHPVVEQFKLLLQNSSQEFQFQNFFYSDNSLYNFIYSSEQAAQQPGAINHRRIVMAFGIEQLPLPRRLKELKQLNLGREILFQQQIILIFWLNKADFLDEFRSRAPDFWDWRGKVVRFTTRPAINPLLYPYLEWLIADNSYLRTSGVMQVQRQVDIFLDQIYVSLQAVRRQEITETLDGNTSKVTRGAYKEGEIRQRVSVASSSVHELDEPGYYEYTESIFEYEPVVTTSKKVTQKVDLSQAVRENRYTIILGAPGAGKTTLMHYLALHFATAKRDGEEKVTGGENKEDLGEVRLPIFFRIADYAERLEQQPDLSLCDYLCQFYRQWETYFENEVVKSGINPKSKINNGLSVFQNPIAQLLLEQMRLGHCLMLLDGLDEVFDQKIRKLIVQRIDEFVDAFSSNKFVITSRIAGYRDVQLSSRFSEFTIEDMSGEQVENFLYRWCQAIERAQQPEAREEQWQRAGKAQAREIIKAIQANEGVKRLTANPLLLTILALIHRNGERLPNRRVKLYELAVQTLTEDWQLKKKLPDANRVLLSQNEVVELLAPLADWMHEEKPSGSVSEAEVEQKLAEKLAELNDTEPESDSVRQKVQEFLRTVRETTGLFVERAPDVYGFMHLTFEEYFAALYIADNDPSEILETIDLRLHEPRWREPILLALGYYGVHFPRMINRLVEKLFKKLDNYQPALECGEIKIKNAAAPDAMIIWSGLQGEAENTCIQSEFPLQNLLFAGQVITEVEVNNSSIRKKLIQKLVLTYVGLDADFEDDVIKQLLRLLRQIELFNQKGEVIAKLKQVGESSIVSQEMRVKVQSAILYIACGEAGTELAECVTDIVNQLEPSLFNSIRNLVAELGDEMTPALEIMRQNQDGELEQKQALDFITGMSYIRSDNYDKAIAILDEIDCYPENNISAYISWSLAICYEGKEKFEQAIDYYQECFEKLSRCIEPSALFLFWRNIGICYRLQEKYEKSIECLQKALAITREFNKPKEESLILYYIGRSYQAWGKYENAIAHHQQSLELYQKLDKQSNVANQWGWLANTYREWGNYEQAIECRQKYLQIYQNLDNQSNVALSYYHLGRIYQGWGKYEDAIAYYQQSRNLYQQLNKQSDVADLWYFLADCYREWGKYEDAIAHYQQSLELYQQLDKQSDVANQWFWLAFCDRKLGKYQQAIDCEFKELEIHQQLDDQTRIALAYWQLGHIYQGWGKYEDAIAHYQQSLQLYQQLDKQSDVADLWYRLANCYWEWGKYQQAIDCELKDLAIRQQLDEQTRIALAYYQLGRIYQGWGKYEDAIAHHQQSLELYQQLDKQSNVADLWYWLADCYREWGEYQQAIDCELKDLAIRQQLDEQTRIALAYYQLGRIYQGWGKYEDAIANYQQSLQLYEQLHKHKNVASRWYNLAECYREWGKYQQALECQRQCMTIRQTLDNQSLVAVTYYQLGRIYQGWGKYEDAIAHHQQSLQLYQQLDLQNDVANRWYWLAVCYREWGKYQQAIDCELKDLEIRQQLDEQKDIADAYYQLGRIYQAWGKYENAIAHHQQSLELYQQLDLKDGVAHLLSWLASCYRNLENYPKAIEYDRQSRDLHQQLGQNKSVAIRCVEISYSQRRLAKDTQDKSEAFNLLAQAEQNIHQAIEINTAGEYTESLAYDHIALSLIDSEYLRLLPAEDSSLPEKIAQFEENYHTGFTYLHQLGQTINQADAALDIACAYLEINALENLERAEELAQTSLQIFQEYNRRQLEASAHKLLGEIYLKRAQTHQPGAQTTAHQFLSASLQIYQELDLHKKVAEVEKLMHP